MIAEHLLKVHNHAEKKNQCGLVHFMVIVLCVPLGTM